jgi:N-acetyl-anhydromuramyl-L-alanine amidase AmpD
MSYFTTPPLHIIDRPADARHTAGPRAAADILYIILHSTVGSLSSSLDWLTTNPNSNVSVHRLVDQNGDIYKIADDLVICNHVGYSRMGNTSPNPYALGIEMVNRNDGTDTYELAQIESVVLQVREWKGLYGDIPVMAHAQIDTRGKTDPFKFPWPRFYERFYARLAEVI